MITMIHYESQASIQTLENINIQRVSQHYLATQLTLLAILYISCHVTIIILMDIQKPTPQQTHNLLLTTFLPSQQIKFLTFLRIDSPKIILHNNNQLRFITGLVAATINTIKLFSIYENGAAFQVGSWRLHEDIIGVAGWDRVIVVNTAQKVIGLRYEAGTLKNAFLISLEFLKLDEQDVCSVVVDEKGYYFVIHIRNYLLLCFSEVLTGKYRARVQERFKVEQVSEEVRWNQPSKNHVLDMVKLKLINLEINKIEQLQIMDETIYFMGTKCKEKALYFIHVYYFFNTLQTSQAVTAVPNKDQPPMNSKVIVFHSHLKGNMNRDPDFLYFSKGNNVTLKTQQSTYDVGTYQGTYQLLHQSVSLFPLLVWQKDKHRISLVERVKTFQENYQFKTKQLADKTYAQTLIYREGLILYASRTGLYLLTTFGVRERIHQSLGNIIDFHIGKDMLLIQNHQGRITKLHELTKGPRIDPKPFVTHKKKMFLEDLADLNAIYSFAIGRKGLEILAARRGTGSNRTYSFFREGANQFQCVLDEVKDYEEAKINGESVVLVNTKAEASFMLVPNEKEFTIVPFVWSGWKLPKRWCEAQYLIAHDDKQTWYFYNIITQKERKVEFQKIKDKEISIFIQFRKITHDRTLRDHDLVEICFFYAKQMHIWLLDLAVGEIHLIHVSKSLFQGSPILSNQLIFPQSHVKDSFRSLTCPQYNLNDHGLRTIAEPLATAITAAYLYQYNDKTLVIMINNEDVILIYKKYFNSQDGGFIFRRINTPLNIVKNFKWGNDKSFVKLGQGIIKFGNVLIYKGELVESIPARSLFRMQGLLWGLLGQGKIRMIHLGSSVYEGFCIRQIESGITEEMMGIESTSQYYCVFSRKSFEIFSKDFVPHWRCILGNQTIVCLLMFDHYIGMSYYDYYCDQDGVNDYNSVRFRFRIYNCATKNKIIEREKPLDEPILHIRYMAPDKLILVTSSLIFVNVLKNDKSIELYRTHNFNSKRSFLSSFAYLPDKLPQSFGAPGKPGYMLFGGSHGGLGFFVGKWIEGEMLKEQWFQGFRCGIRQVCFFGLGEEKEDLLKALIADDDGNLIALTLNIEHAEKMADIRLGANVNTFKTRSGTDRVVFCSMSDGSIKMITAIKLDSEVSYLDFQKSFCEELPFYGGFNLRTSRRLLQKYRSSRLVSRGNVVDGDILECFFSLTQKLKSFVLESSDMEFGPLRSMLPY